MSRTTRKLDHIRYALSTGQSHQTGFDDISFVHQSLPDISVEDIRMDTKIGELSLSSPIFINAMTGGGGEQTYRINQMLAIIARENGMAMALGSQMSALKYPMEQNTYEIVRKENPNGIIIANLGSEATVEQVKKAIDLVEANAVQLHLNVVQELVMPEGDRHFKDALKRIEKIKSVITEPIIIKEVGFGMSKETVQKLLSIGIDIIDVGGFGGTNFSKIENARSSRKLSFFDEWGIPTAISIAEARSITSSLSIIGSGGIQTSMDVAKSIALGANATAMAGYILHHLTKNGVEEVIKIMGEIHDDLKYIMTALGVKTITELQQVPIVMKGDTYHWLSERGIETKHYSQRQNKNSQG